MSNPVKNHELEDVLSSIRRLVSEDGYGGSTPEKTEDIPTEVADVSIGRKRPETPLSDKLLLTEDFLVSESETTQKAENHETTIETLVLDHAHSIEAPVEQAEPDDVLVLNSVFDDLATEAEADRETADVAVESEPAQTTHDEAVTESPEAIEPAEIEIVQETPEIPEAAAEDEQSTEVEHANEVSQDVAADNETSIIEVSEDEDYSDEGAQFEPTATEEDDAQTEEVHEHDAHHEEMDIEVHIEDENDTVEEVEHEAVHAVQITELDDVEDAITIETEDTEHTQHHQVSGPTGFAHTVAELEAVISAQNDDWEPDGSEEAGASPEIEPLEWRSEATRGAKVFEMPRADAPTAMPGFQGETELDDDIDFGLEDFSEDDAPLLDEAALRDMVSDIVRQELQGPLGERITRNVRKLVRREIHRILASEDFD